MSSEAESSTPIVECVIGPVVTFTSAAATVWLVGDIGATNARFGLVSPDGTLLHSRTLADENYPAIEDALAAFLAERGEPCGRNNVALPPASIAASGAVAALPGAISIWQPAPVAIRAAASFVTMPPEL